MAAGTEAPRVRLKPILLPAEHGSWSLLAEPILLGLLIRFSPAGLLVAASSVFAFLAYRPLRIALADSRRARSVPRTRVAWTWGLGLAGVAAGMIAASVWFGGP
ncbi:MAG: YwiC-like family protein, partial [Fimbriimonadaceae bacterium]|nr:YwiC-like family protein [Fimbriimonadaceae bacterium]